MKRGKIWSIAGGRGETRLIMEIEIRKDLGQGTTSETKTTGMQGTIMNSIFSKCMLCITTK